jgi:hypothetical protein
MRLRYSTGSRLYYSRREYGVLPHRECYRTMVEVCASLGHLLVESFVLLQPYHLPPANIILNKSKNASTGTMLVLEVPEYFLTALIQYQ